MEFIKFAKPNGGIVWINPANVSALEQVPSEDGRSVDTAILSSNGARYIVAVDTEVVARALVGLR